MINTNKINNIQETQVLPIIFTKKVGNRSKIIPLKTPNNIGYVRFFPPSTKEWSSSICSYNANNVNSYPVKDKFTIKLVKSYLNFYHSYGEKTKTQRILLRFRRISLNKIFVSKAELKHTNTKVIITIYVYNGQLRLLVKRIKSLKALSFFKHINYYKFLLNINQAKFEKNHILKLCELVSRIYNKKVEFNIVNQKYMYLNSDILSEAITLKLKNRNNKLLRVLKSALSMVKLPKTNKFKDKVKGIRVESLREKIQNLDITKDINIVNMNAYRPPFYYNNETNDSLNQLLFNIIPGPYLFDLGSTQSLNYFVLNNLKNKSIGGVRLEAKGRLTRRFTASRSVFKVKWIGGLKNIDSSNKGLSSVMLRGHAKSNVQYTLINSKNRNGAFGIKCWVSGK